MKTEKGINSIVSYSNDIWHYKLTDIPIKKEDYFSTEYFTGRISEPFEIYDRYIRAIDFEKRICHKTIELPNSEFPFPISDEEAAELHHGQSDEVFKYFAGEYDEEMKRKINEYIKDMGFAGLTRKDYFMDHVPGFRNMPYSCSIYRQEHTLGFYLKRVGVLRGCFNPSYYDSMRDNAILGGLGDFEKLAKHFDKNLITHMYGEQGWKTIKEYYRKNFLESFEYGVSFLFREEGYFEH